MSFIARLNCRRTVRALAISLSASCSLVVAFGGSCFANENESSDVLTGTVQTEKAPEAPTARGPALQGNVSRESAATAESSAPVVHGATGELSGHVTESKNPHNRALPMINVAFGSVYEPAPKFNMTDAINGFSGVINSINSFSGYSSGGGYSGGGYGAPARGGCR